ncbi:hypothetical protein O181_101183 [Austropuccinia psidii MF-1]|uniref:Reverse transcriptase domain-containing protein n=1 Tax=Austropuccinia psidii MF-1 TaxID=1389203 RepID=A0A9Q3PGV5_9BASI|nr:hypothetical protein [Austropuccinia psidii MF-1]
MVGNYRALNTYTVPSRYPIPRIQETLTQLSKDKYITSMDALKGFHKNVLTPKAKKLLRIITQCGIYEYLIMPFGMKNAPNPFQHYSQCLGNFTSLASASHLIRPDASHAYKPALPSR